jgi:hypothetical protein
MPIGESFYKFKDITRKSADDPPPWYNVHTGEGKGKPPWAPQKATERQDDDGEEEPRRVPVFKRERVFPRWDVDVKGKVEEPREPKAEGSWWIAKLRRLICSRRRREKEAGLSQPLLPTDALDMGDEERKVRRITPSCYNAMEIHGFFGLVDDGPCSSGRMLIVHQPSWVRGYFLDIRDGDDIHVWHVSGTSGGVLRVLSTGRHRYYSPGQKVTTCTVCVPEEQWERLMQ